MMPRRIASTAMKNRGRQTARFENRQRHVQVVGVTVVEGDARGPRRQRSGFAGTSRLPGSGSTRQYARSTSICAANAFASGSSGSRGSPLRDDAMIGQYQQTSPSSGGRERAQEPHARMTRPGSCAQLSQATHPIGAALFSIARRRTRARTPAPRHRSRSFAARRRAPRAKVFRARLDRAVDVRPQQRSSPHRLRSGSAFRKRLAGPRHRCASKRRPVPSPWIRTP